MLGHETKDEQYQPEIKPAEDLRVAWDDLEWESKIDRMRLYTKERLGAICSQLNRIENRLESMENHEHTQKGIVVPLNRRTVMTLSEESGKSASGVEFV